MDSDPPHWINLMKVGTSPILMHTAEGQIYFMSYEITTPQMLTEFNPGQALSVCIEQ